jgi:phage terminase small subunit
MDIGAKQFQTTMAASKKPAARKTQPKGDGAAKERKLTPKRERFVEEYLIDLNATQAAIRAGYSVKTAEDIGRQLLRKTPVAAAITSQRAKVSERAEINAAWVLRQWADIASADPNDLVQYRRSCCRHCWGVGHAYQWTDAEIERERFDAVNKGKPAPDESGGVGFVLNREPNSLCPECGGEGRGRLIAADTRKLPPRAKRLYAGAKLGKDGLEIKMRDQDGALANIAKHLGMFPSKVELTGKDGGPIQLQKAHELTDDELATIAAAGRAGTADPP